MIDSRGRIINNDQIHPTEEEYYQRHAKETAVIPKEEILDAIYHSYQDKWLLLSKGKGENKGADNCALCQLMKCYDICTSPFFKEDREKLCTTECPIAIDERQCDSQGSLYKEYTNSVAMGGLTHPQTLRVAGRFAYYLLDLYARVNQDKVNLPYLAGIKFASEHMNEAAGKPEPVEKKKEWKLVDRNRIEAVAITSLRGVVVYILVDNQKVAYFVNTGGVVIMHDWNQKIKVSLTEKHESGSLYYNTILIYEYI